MALIDVVVVLVRRVENVDCDRDRDSVHCKMVLWERSFFTCGQQLPNETKRLLGGGRSSTNGEGRVERLVD